MASPLWGSSNGVSLIRKNMVTRTPTAHSAWPASRNPAGYYGHPLGLFILRGVEQLEARQVHSLEVAGSIPAAAIWTPTWLRIGGSVCCRMGRLLRRRSSPGNTVTCVFDKFIAIRR
jgi:hypothetical protein